MVPSPLKIRTKTAVATLRIFFLLSVMGPGYVLWRKPQPTCPSDIRRRLLEQGGRAESLGGAFQWNVAARAASKRSNCKGPPGLPCAVTPQGTWPPCFPSNLRADHNDAQDERLSSSEQLYKSREEKIPYPSESGLPSFGTPCH